LESEYFIELNFKNYRKVFKKMTMGFAQRVKRLKPEGAYAMLARAQELEALGKDIVHLEIGQPDFQTFSHIADAGIEAVRAGQTRYNPPSGIKELCCAIARDAGIRRNICISPDQVVVGPGAKPGLFFPTMALVEPGDRVLYPDPGFPTYEAMILAAGGTPVPVPLVEENDFSFDLEVFESLINEKTKMIILNSPGNPTGGVIPERDLKEIAKAANKYDCWVLSDEIYSRLVYDRLGVPSIAGLPGMAERTVIVDGFSKTYAMAGWRLGYMIAPVPLAERLGLMMTHAVGCTATFTQFAGLEALTGPQDKVDEVVAEYETRRDLMVGGLNSIPGISCRKPQGAFYTFPNIRETGFSSEALAVKFLEEAGVSCLSGTDFGQHGQGYLRLCYATSPEDINKALDRIADCLK